MVRLRLPPHCHVTSKPVHIFWFRLIVSRDGLVAVTHLFSLLSSLLSCLFFSHQCIINLRVVFLEMSMMLSSAQLQRSRCLKHLNSPKATPHQMGRAILVQTLVFPSLHLLSSPRKITPVLRVKVTIPRTTSDEPWKVFRSSPLPQARVQLLW